MRDPDFDVVMESIGGFSFAQSHFAIKRAKLSDGTEQAQITFRSVRWLPVPWRHARERRSTAWSA